ncbi:transporter substrate-binding domain-containing protein [Spongiactinospora sp. TRM90649]|uniref:transporter substrate-binding domain-containing protein n=1 Tax=Spongiactinospora sp. TRM90649 TaxID=3031114 RepID=UPI0023F8BE05|nr:transporter substrate-binding domain-containing protein [Spongiactinospora sp. TRM90649]MDF5754303.1 transporter substrate-binding domain-containing protein [Spongiactinospora sp. TRM90649]
MGELESFPRELARAKEQKTGNETLAERTGLLPETIRQLTGGTELLSWEITSVYLDACGQEPADWRERWEQAAQRSGWQVWRRRRTPLGPLPDPATARTFAELCQRMEHLRHMVGLTFNTLEQRAADQRRRLPHATLNAALKGRGRLERELVEAFAAACGLPPAESRRWRAAWQRIAAMSALEQRPDGLTAGGERAGPDGYATPGSGPGSGPGPGPGSGPGSGPGPGSVAASASGSADPGTAVVEVLVPPAEQDPDSPAGVGAVGSRPAAQHAPSRSARHRRVRRRRTLAVLAGAAAVFIAGTGTGWMAATRSPSQALTLSGPPYTITADQPLSIPLPLSERRDWILDMRLRLGFTPAQELQNCSYHAWLTYQVVGANGPGSVAHSETGRKDVAVNDLRLGITGAARLVVTLRWKPSTPAQPAAPPRCELTLDPSRSVLRQSGTPATPITTPAPSRADIGNGPLTGKPVLKIGVKIDQPAIGEMVNNNPDDRRGIDPDLAREIARRLNAEVEFHDVTSSSRETLLQRGQVDMVIASYSMNEPRRDKITFAGPYLVAGQDILVRASDPSIDDIDDLKDKKVCGVKGSTSTQRVIDHFGAEWDTPEHMTRQHGYGVCVEELRAGRVDAVSTDNSILAGYIAKHPGELRLLRKPFSVEEYGIGLARNNVGDAERINTVLKQMIADKTWQAILDKNLKSEAGTFISSVPSIP